jgi:hypothetical protein
MPTSRRRRGVGRERPNSRSSAQSIVREGGSSRSSLSPAEPNARRDADGVLDVERTDCEHRPTFGGGRSLPQKAVPIYLRALGVQSRRRIARERRANPRTGGDSPLHRYRVGLEAHHQGTAESSESRAGTCRSLMPDEMELVCPICFKPLVRRPGWGSLLSYTCGHGVLGPEGLRPVKRPVVTATSSAEAVEPA